MVTSSLDNLRAPGIHRAGHASKLVVQSSTILGPVSPPVAGRVVAASNPSKAE